MKSTMTISALVFAVSSFCFANNPPVVKAGPDTTIRLGILPDFRFQGSVSDELEWPELEIQWTQASGPQDGAEIMVKDAEGSQVAFSKTGIYRFVLTANDGQFRVSDTVTITVQERLPLIILNPIAGQKVELGSTLVIRWQVYPYHAAMRVDLSTDGGATMKPLASQQTVDSLVWNVPEDLEPSDECVLRVFGYFWPELDTVSAVFSLVPKGSLSASSHPRAGRGQSIEPSGTSAGSEVFGISGRSIRRGARSRGVVLVRDPAASAQGQMKKVVKP